MITIVNIDTVRKRDLKYYTTIVRRLKYFETPIFIDRAPNVKRVVIAHLANFKSVA